MPPENTPTTRRTVLPLCAVCYGFYPCDDCHCSGVTPDEVHVTEWDGEQIVRQYAANPLDGPNHLEIGLRAHLAACVASR